MGNIPSELLALLTSKDIKYLAFCYSIMALEHSVEGEFEKKDKKTGKDGEL